MRLIFSAAIVVMSCFANAHAATVQTFYTQSSASDFINPACDSGRQAGPTSCSAAGQVLRNGDPFFGGESQSFADLARGVLHASAKSFGNAQFSPRVDGHANASARLFDTLTFAGPIGPDDFATVTMIATLTHSDIPFTSSQNQFGAGNVFMELEALTGDGRVMTRAFACTPNTAVCNNNPNVGNYELSVHDNTYTIRGRFRLVDLGTPRTLQLLLVLASESSGFAAANADDPILISLPAGITYTSASGVFLSAVPLPPSLPLLAAAVASLAFFEDRCVFETQNLTPVVARLQRQRTRNSVPRFPSAAPCSIDSKRAVILQRLLNRGADRCRV